MTTPVVAVWRSELLRGSETFIRDQTDAFVRWTPLLLGAVKVESPLTRPTDRVLYSDSLWDRAALAVAAATGWAPRITRALRESGAQLVHAHFLKDACLIGGAARRAGLPLIVTCHGYDVTALPARPGWRGAVYRRQARRTLRKAHTVVAVSDFIAGKARELGAEAPVVLYTGIRTREIPATEKTADLVFVGRLVEKKGVPDLLRAVALAEQELGRTVTTEIIGDGPLRAALESAAGEGVRFRGPLPPEGVDAALSRSRIFVGPSVIAPDGDTEGFGQVFLEAGLAGLPAISYNSGGVPESVLDGHTGLLATPGDVEGLARHIVRLLRDPELRGRLGCRGRERARGPLSMQARGVVLEELYDAVTGRVSPGR